ncbi:hypothetical protein GCM10010329_65510 [Streptomyces spiroverticillatus]|uniref:Rpn family recombination-promoting nuclease/putative transposase n=1 Tax=Streptomyces finlayi TaxID=67296 RepID=A0A918X461_9ACTN|nr:hypothetical protein [Streptomyces finlayi]GHA33013.1 hypothetical protein GCM10010329_65510 [Streptomyces spiroverticillatus]GHD10189.1 hypothetical protein GCM10010334_65040 [Streptomyces finlayi]
MVSAHHESLHKVFQRDTGLLIDALQELLGVDFPAYRKIEPVNVDLTEIEAIERRADTILRIETKGEPYFVILESQGRPAERKRRSWAYYLAYLLDKYDGQPVLLVLCHDRATARWAAKPIEFGLPGLPSLVVRPLVLGPDNVPVMAEPEQVRSNVPLAVFAAITHGNDPGVAAILKSLAEALDELDPNEAVIYAEYVEAGLSDVAAQQTWRKLMDTLNIFFRSEAARRTREEGREAGREEGLEEGQAVERARMVCTVLERRGLEPSLETRERIAACRDLEVLGRWAELAWSVSSAEEIFAEEE